MLAKRQNSHFLTCLFVRLFAILFLVFGACCFVSGMVGLALGGVGFVVVLQGLLLLLSGFLLMRLRVRGLWVFAVLVLLAYSQFFLDKIDDFWSQFLLSLLLLLILCLLSLSYFSLCRGEGRRPRRSMYFFVTTLYMALTFLSFAAYYDDAFCDYKQAQASYDLKHFDLIGQPLHVSLDAALSQWFVVLPCYADGDLFPR